MSTDTSNNDLIGEGPTGEDPTGDGATSEGPTGDGATHDGLAPDAPADRPQDHLPAQPADPPPERVVLAMRNPALVDAERSVLSVLTWLLLAIAVLRLLRMIGEAWAIRNGNVPTWMYTLVATRGPATTPHPWWEWIGECSVPIDHVLSLFLIVGVVGLLRGSQRARAWLLVWAGGSILLTSIGLFQWFKFLNWALQRGVDSTVQFLTESFLTSMEKSLTSIGVPLVVFLLLARRNVSSLYLRRTD